MLAGGYRWCGNFSALVSYFGFSSFQSEIKNSWDHSSQIHHFLGLNIGLGVGKLTHGNWPQTNLARQNYSGDIGNNLKISAEQSRTDSLDNVLARIRSINNQSRADLIIWRNCISNFNLKCKIRSRAVTIPQVFRQVLQTSGHISSLVATTQNTNHASYDFLKVSIIRHSCLPPILPSPSVYHKHQLIPLAKDYLFGAFNRPLSALLSNISFFAKGSEFPLFQLPKGTIFITAICCKFFFPILSVTILPAYLPIPHFIIN